MDIDVLRPGLPARVLLPAFQQRNLPQIMGRVRQVAADATADPQTGKMFFEVRVEIDPGQLAALEPPLELTPGMPAEVYITTGERTALDYLLGPFYDSLRRAFRET
jgi:multidrug efflux pump subunit AcrA (membrane-fusion protein)